MHKNKNDTERIYYCVECEYYSLYRQMFSLGWNKTKEIQSQRNGISGYEVTFIKSIPTKSVEINIKHYKEAVWK